jgi:omega-6 fatty acid desaturase (delta-12 desaturase)
MNGEAKIPVPCPKSNAGNTPCVLSAAESEKARNKSDRTELHERLAAHQGASAAKSWLQVANTFGAFGASFFCAWLMLGTFPLAAPVFSSLCGVLLVRIFSIQHDCGHYAFFPRRADNRLVGYVCGLFTLTPFLAWRRLHAHHHATSNDLDRRIGGFYSNCLTIEEYLTAKPLRRALYRFIRSRVVLFLILAPFIFIVVYRFPFDTPKSWRRERRNIQWTNLALAALFGGVWAAGIAVDFLIVYLPAIWVASAIGSYMFFVQHQYEGAQWFRQDSWDFDRVGLESSLYLKLPPVLQWMTGNIGLHHIHHLNPRIPNYRLARCQADIEPIAKVPHLNWREALEAARFNLWDDRRKRMIRFSDLEACDVGDQPVGNSWQTH